MEYFKNKYVWITVPYFLSVGILYLWAYWGSFEVNVFAFASISDLVKAAIIPVGSTVIYTFLGFLLGALAINIFFPNSSSKAPKYSNKAIGIIKYLSAFSLLILLYFIFISKINQWLAIPIFGAITLYLLLVSTSFLEEVSIFGVRGVLILVVCYLPFFSYCQGRLDSNKIINNESYSYVESIAGVQNAKYLGFLGQNLILLSNDNSKLIIQKMTDDPLVLIKNTNPPIAAAGAAGTMVSPTQPVINIQAH